MNLFLRSVCKLLPNGWLLAGGCIVLLLTSAHQTRSQERQHQSAPRTPLSSPARRHVSKRQKQRGINRVGSRSRNHFSEVLERLAEKNSMLLQTNSETTSGTSSVEQPQTFEDPT